MKTAILRLLAVSGAAAMAALVVFVPSIPGLSGAAQAQAQAGDLGNAVSALRSIKTMRADFSQTDDRGRQLRGVLTLKRPGRIRFQYEKGVPVLVVSDGTALTFVDYQVRQVQRWPIRNSPLGALLDPNGDAIQYGKLTAATNNVIVAVEVRDKKHPEYGTITLVFIRRPGAPGGLELTSWATVDGQNRRTLVVLSNQQYGVDISDNNFKFNDPRIPTRR